MFGLRRAELSQKRHMVSGFLWPFSFVNHEPYISTKAMGKRAPDLVRSACDCEKKGEREKPDTGLQGQAGEMRESITNQ